MNNIISFQPLKVTRSSNQHRSLLAFNEEGEERGIKPIQKIKNRTALDVYCMLCNSRGAVVKETTFAKYKKKSTSSSFAKKGTGGVKPIAREGRAGPRKTWAQGGTCDSSLALSLKKGVKGE